MNAPRFGEECDAIISEDPKVGTRCNKPVILGLVSWDDVSVDAYVCLEHAVEAHEHGAVLEHLDPDARPS